MLHIVLSDDWELRGNGTGNPRRLQFATARALMALYEAHGMRGSFNADLMQQLAFRRAAARHPEIGAIADEWDACVREMLRRGHDVQLHTHPQWDGAVFEGGRFVVGPEWSLHRCPEDKVRRILSDSLGYLLEVARREDSAYRCVAYRAGAWAMAPSATILPTLAGLGITLDMSIVAGMYHDTTNVSFDYRAVDEGYRPFYPEMTDARRMSAGPEPIVCMPTTTACAIDDAQTEALRERLGPILADPSHPEHAAYALPPDRIKVEGADEPLTAEPPLPLPPKEPAPVPRVPSPAVPQAMRGISPNLRVFDLSSLSYLHMRQMLAAVRRRAAAEPGPLPVILENHTKYLGDLRPVAKFLEHLASSGDVKILTARELAQNIRLGLYPVRTRFSLHADPARIRHALGSRLAEVRSRLETASSPAAAPSPAPEDAEETLRRFMVRTFAALAARRAPDGGRDAFLSQLARLAEPARGPDWRYLDAWNNAYEVLDSLGPDVPAASLRWLLETYAGLLSLHLSALPQGAGAPGAAR